MNNIYNLPTSINKPKRINWKKELKLERNRVLEEIRKALIDHKRTIPKEWERAYMSAVTVVERLKYDNSI